MPLILRMSTRRARWGLVDQHKEWVPNGEFHGDPFGDLATKDGVLSVWLVKDDKSDLNDVAASLATTRSLSHFEYVLIDQAYLKDFDIEKQDGATPLSAFRTLHCNIVHLTMHKLHKLADVLLEKHAEIDRLNQRDLEDHLAVLAKNGLFPRTEFEAWTNLTEKDKGKLSKKIESACKANGKTW